MNIKPHMLTKEELRNIKVPLSDDDYMLLSRHYPLGVWVLGKEFHNLYDAFLNKRSVIFDQVFPGNKYSLYNKTWYPPQTEKYKDEAVNVWLREDRERMKKMVPKILSSQVPLEDRYELEEYVAGGLKEYGIQPDPPSWLEWPGDQEWPPYWLVKERLKEVELPLSDEDYVWIHDVVLPVGIKLKCVSKELDEEYDYKMWIIYRQLFPEDTTERDVIPWFPPQTEEFKDHPINVRLRERRSVNQKKRYPQ